MNSKRSRQAVSPRVPDLLDVGLASSDDLVALAGSTSQPLTPEIVPFVDGRRDGRRARQRLVDLGEEFRTIPAQRQRIPVVVCGGVLAERLAECEDVFARGALATSFEAGLTKRPLRASSISEWWCIHSRWPGAC